MKVLMLWHAGGDPLNRPLCDRLIARPDLDLLVLTAKRTDDRLAAQTLEREIRRTDRRTGSSYRIVPTPLLFKRHLGRLVYPALPLHLRAFRPDLLHVVLEAATLGAAHAALCRSLFAPRARFVLHPIQNISHRYPWPASLLEPYVLARTDAAVAYSPGALATVRQAGFKGPTTIQPFGLDETILKPGRPSPVRKRLGRGAPFIGWAGRMFLGKGLHVLLQASRMMKKKHRLLIVGDGYRRPAEQQLAHDLGLDDRTFWAGAVKAPEMPDWYAAMDVFCHPAISRPTDLPLWKEQFARTLSEAMLCGLPVVASRSGEIPWVVGNGGLLVPENNPRLLAKALDRVLGSAPLRRRLANAGRSRVLELFTWERSAAGLHSFWRACLTA